MIFSWITRQQNVVLIPHLEARSIALSNYDERTSLAWNFRQVGERVYILQKNNRGGRFRKEISSRSRREEKEFIFEGIFEDLDDNYYEEREKDLINELR